MSWVITSNDVRSDGNLDERLWVVQDANWHVTALLGLVDADGPGGNPAEWQVVERYIYDPFGSVTVLDAEWNERSSGSEYDWLYLHQGGRFDVTSGLYHFRHRDYSPTLGRWTTLDPIRYLAGDVNLYRYVANNSPSKTDPSGLQERPVPNPIDAAGRFYELPPSLNLIRVIVGPSDKPTLLKNVPFWKKENPIRPLDKPKFAVRVVTSDRGWVGVIPKGACIGPDGCGPCVGIALIPPKTGEPVYIMHFSAQSDVWKGFEEVEFIRWKAIYFTTPKGELRRTWTKEVPVGYEAVICGALMPHPKEPDFERVNNQRLHTLEDVVNTCRRLGVKIRCFLPTSGFAIDENNQIWWTTGPAPSEVDRYER